MTKKSDNSKKQFKDSMLNPEWCEVFMGFPRKWTDVSESCERIVSDYPLPLYEKFLWRTLSAGEPGVSVKRILKPNVPGGRMYDSETGRLVQYGIEQQTEIYSDSEYGPNEPEKRILKKDIARSEIKGNNERLRLLGNSVVPGQAELFFKTIWILDDILKRRSMSHD